MTTFTIDQINATLSEICRRDKVYSAQVKKAFFPFANSPQTFIGYLIHDAHGRWTGYSRSGVRLFHNTYTNEREAKARLLTRVQEELSPEPVCGSCGVVLCTKTCANWTDPDPQLTPEENAETSPEYCDGCNHRD